MTNSHAPSHEGSERKSSGFFPAVGLVALIGVTAVSFSDRRPMNFDPQLAIEGLSHENADAIRNLVHNDAMACVAGHERSQTDVVQKLRALVGKTADDVSVFCGNKFLEGDPQYTFSASTGSPCDKTYHTYGTNDGEKFRLKHESSTNCYTHDPGIPGSSY